VFEKMQTDSKTSGYITTKLTEEMKQSLDTNGYLIIEDYLSPEKCEEAIAELKKLIDNYEPDETSLTIFSTTSHDQRRSQYFRDSADKISFFYEKDAFKDGKLVVPKEHAFNKIGHALHEKSPLFAEMTFSPLIQEICKFIGYADPAIPQSMAILKPPKIGGEVTPHQDATFLYSDPETLMGFWVPLEDATKENGCLWGIPGSHKWPLFRRYKHNPVTNEEYFEELAPSQTKDDEFVPLEMKKGSLVIFPGHFVHKSHQNFSEKSRFAYTWHLYDCRKSTWAKDNWLQRPEFPKFEKKYHTVSS
jgi:phytanoyl-CoA hydroxylase